MSRSRLLTHQRRDVRSGADSQKRLKLPNVLLMRRDRKALARRFHHVDVVDDDVRVHDLVGIVVVILDCDLRAADLRIVETEHLRRPRS